MDLSIIQQFIKANISSENRGMNLIEFADNSIEIYISFQTLLKFIDEYIVVKDKNNKPIVKIDWENDKPFYALSCHISCDLKKCYLFNSSLGLEDGITPNSGIATFQPFTFFSEENRQIFDNINNDLKINSKVPAGQESLYAYPQVGNINYIYLNLGYLSNIITNNIDKENKLAIRDFLQTICDDANRALGGINDFQVVVNADVTPNLLTIVDINQNRVKGLPTVFSPKENITTIQAQGLGTFVKNISAQSQITSEIASSIAIGAQANANQLGEEATSFSRLSKGLIDRIYPQRITTSIPTGSIEENFKGNIATFQNIVNSLVKTQGVNAYVTFTKDENSGPVVTDLFKAIVGEFTEAKISNPTFIPIKLDLELLGISGIRIFEQFQLSGDVLPLSYQNDFNFIITGVSHEITTHKWVTKLAALTYLKDKREPIIYDKEGKVAIKLLNTKPTPSFPVSNSSTTLTKSEVDACIASTPEKVSGYTVTSAIKRKGTAQDITKSNGEYHGGIDIATPVGTPLRFTLAGVKLKEKRFSDSYGNLLVLTSPSGFDFYFAHLNSFSTKINNAKIGDVVTGITLAYTGNTGKSTGPHLHFEVRSKSGKICPNNWLNLIKLG
jgi:murein DD-endopeptidase MepM/ murein hydrolase activator NlpD